MAYVSAEAWKRQLEEQYRNAQIFETALTNKHYEGEVKSNETVHIVHTPGTVTTFDYADAAWADNAWNDYSETKTDFTIDQKKGVRIRIPHTVSATSLPGLIESATQDTAYELANLADAYIGSLYAGITTNVVGSTAAPTVIGFDEVNGELLPSQFLGQMFDLITGSKGITQGLNTVIPSWLAKGLLYELKSRNTGFGDQILRTGAGQGKLEVGGAIEGFEGIFVSNNVYTASDGGGGGVDTYWKVMAGNPNQSITFARRITEQKFLEMQNDFADLLKALHVYGGLVVREKHMALGTVSKGHWPNGISL